MFSQSILIYYSESLVMKNNLIMISNKQKLWIDVPFTPGCLMVVAKM